MKYQPHVNNNCTNQTNRKRQERLIIQAAIKAFPEPILDTSPGELSAAGIPSSFFSCKLHRTKLQMHEIDMDFEKPLNLLTLNESHAGKLLQNLIFIFWVLHNKGRNW